MFCPERRNSLLGFTFYHELFCFLLLRTQKIDKDEIDLLKNSKYGSRMMTFKDNSLFFIKTVMCLMRNLFKTIITQMQKKLFQL